MPHIQIAFTANLEAEVLERKLVDTLHLVAVDSGFFPVWGIRTVAQRLDHYRVGDGAAGNGFVQVFVRIGPRRDLALRQRIAHLLFDALLRSMGPVFETRRLGCQLEVIEFDPELTLLHNNVPDGSGSAVVLHRYPPAS